MSTVNAVDTRLIADVHNTIRSIEAKLRLRFPEAHTELVCGSDDELHLLVYTNSPSMWEPMEWVEDDLAALEEREGVSLFVIPLRLADRHN